MDKQELIEKYKNKCLVTTHFESMEMFRELWKDIKQLDEPQKVVVPRFVADWIEYCKKHSFTLFGCLDPVDGFEKLVNENFEGDARKCIGWCRSASDKLARAWLDGYEVEKEKKCTVRIKATKQYLCNDEIGPHFSPSFRSNFTKTNLEELGFGWVFDCEGIEIEEVE
jgi:hypothetical protein